MKLFSVPALAAAALFSAVFALPFMPLAKTEAGPFYFEVRLTSTSAGITQLYFDRGAGLSEADSSRVALVASATPRWYRLGLPAGTYRALRFDPIDRPGTMTLSEARVVSPSGHVVRAFAPSDFTAANQIVSSHRQGPALAFTTAPNGFDPQFWVTLRTPLTLRPSLLDLLTRTPRMFWIVFVVLAAGLLAFDLIPGWRPIRRRTGQWLARRPKRAVAVIAAAAVVLSAYPVVFLGQSYVSPNLGTSLLYDGFPTLPGYSSRRVADVQLSDVGAIMWQHVPYSMVQHRALAEGELPLWNRANSAGTPLLGQGQSMFGDPLHLLVIAANGASWAWDLKYLIAKWLFATALGLLVFEVLGQPSSGPAERNSEDRAASGRDPTTVLPDRGAFAAALIVAAASAFIGFFVYRLNHPAFFSLCYAPWALYCWLRVVSAGTRRGVALWAAGLIVANLGLMNSGTAKEAYMLLLTMNFSGVCALLASRAPWHIRLAKLVALGWAGVIFTLLTMPVWATFVHTLHHAYTSYNQASAYQLQPSMLLGLFDEVFYRILMPNERLLDPSLNFLLLLGFLYFAATLRGSFGNRTAMALAASSLVPLSLAFGLVPPAWIVRWPLLAEIAHVDNTFSCALIVLWSVLAGVGFAQAARRLGGRDGRGDLVVVALLLFALVFAWIGFRQAVHRPVLGPTTFTVNQPGHPIPVSSFIWGDLAALLAASVLLLVVARRALRRGSVGAAGVILLALGAGVLLWREGLQASSVGFRGFVQEPTVRVDFHAHSPAVAFMQREQNQAPGRGFGLRDNFFPGWTAAYGLGTVSGPDALMSPYLKQLQLASGVDRRWDWRLYATPANVAADRPVLDALNVRWYLDRPGDEAQLAPVLKLAKAADLDVYESPTAWPRAFFTNRVFRYGSAADFVARIRRGSGRPFAAAQSSDAATEDAIASIASGLAGRDITPATAYRLTENNTSFSVDAPGRGVVVLLESWWPDDFRAFLNGRRVPVLRLNHAFKGIVIPAAGEYRVSFHYWPHNFLRSLECCGLGVVLLALSLWAGLRRTA